jgi:hypothetical protein
MAKPRDILAALARGEIPGAPAAHTVKPPPVEDPPILLGGIDLGHRHFGIALVGLSGSEERFVDAHSVCFADDILLACAVVAAWFESAGAAHVVAPEARPYCHESHPRILIALRPFIEECRVRFDLLPEAYWQFPGPLDTLLPERTDRQATRGAFITALYVAGDRAVSADDAPPPEKPVETTPAPVPVPVSPARPAGLVVVPPPPRQAAIWDGPGPPPFSPPPFDGNPLS